MHTSTVPCVMLLAVNILDLKAMDTTVYLQKILSA